MNPFVQRYGSSRPAALLRIGVAFLLWTRFGGEMCPWSSLSPDRLLLDVGFWGSTVLMAMGLWTPLATAWAALTTLVMFYGYGVFGDRDEWNSHHLWVLVSSTALLLLTPCGRSYSLDRWLALRRGEAPREWGWQGGMQLLSLQLSAIYFWSAVDKTSWAFLSGQRLQAIFLNLYLEELPHTAWVTYGVGAVAVVVVAFEYLIAFGIHVRRFHWWLLPAGVVLHLLFYVLLPVSVFSANMILLYLTVLDPNQVHRFIERLQEPHHGEPTDRPLPPEGSPRPIAEVRS